MKKPALKTLNLGNYLCTLLFTTALSANSAHGATSGDLAKYKSHLEQESSGEVMTEARTAQAQLQICRANHPVDFRQQAMTGKQVPDPCASINARWLTANNVLAARSYSEGAPKNSVPKPVLADDNLPANPTKADLAKFQVTLQKANSVQVREAFVKWHSKTATCTINTILAKAQEQSPDQPVEDTCTGAKKYEEVAYSVMQQNGSTASVSTPPLTQPGKPGSSQSTGGTPGKSTGNSSAGSASQPASQ
jgi:hypothetical protein